MHIVGKRTILPNWSFANFQDILRFSQFLHDSFYILVDISMIISSMLKYLALNGYLRIDNSRYGPFCCGRSILRTNMALLRPYIHTIYYFKADFITYLMI